jgi:hypothetical protein
MSAPLGVRTWVACHGRSLPHPRLIQTAALLSNTPEMRLFAWSLAVLWFVSSYAAELTGGFYGEEGKEPKTWQEDVAYMISVSHAEPALRGTFERVEELARRGTKLKVRKEYSYSLFSIPTGVLGFRIEPNSRNHGVHPNFLIGVHPSASEPLPLPFRVGNKVGSIPLLAKKSVVLPHPPVDTESDTYFSEKCTVYVYGAGHWITRYFVSNDRVLAISFALEP